MRRSAALPGLLLAALLAAAGCAGPRSGPAQGAPPPTEEPTATAVATNVPSLDGLKLPYAKAVLAEAKLAAVVRYAPEILVDRDTVVLSEPKAGSAAVVGDVVVLVVAGKPVDPAGFEGHPGARALALLAEERPDVFVGVGYQDGNPAKPFVIALSPGVDPASWQARIAAAAGEEPYRVRRCEHSLTQLRQVQVGIGEADFLAAGSRAAFSTALEPARCAVVLSGSFGPQEKERIQAKWGSAVVIEAAR